MRKIVWALFSMLLILPAALQAQEEASRYMVDGLQIDLKSVAVEKDTLTVTLSLVSFRMDPREFTLNTFATQVVDAEGNGHLYSTLTMGRVMVRLEDQQNYLHYLLEEDKTVPLRLQVANWKGEKPKQLILVFQDSEEEGKFIQETVGL
ncbi:hypothetical protein [Sphingobacterium wenxiniae]|uniref:Uncharacterized protein n=1 Tax=Sphingobacterium wenxiniae TaxID=683125 RepID=A0A1I6S0A1_9SPHI|nr:hypothetical protein [Sphingobacterium wenxiniae]SFS70354.1 hypothetical protein SAMN05660206_10449 [Sphingobacterium wenxiniae]